MNKELELVAIVLTVVFALLLTYWAFKKPSPSSHTDDAGPKFPDVQPPHPQVSTVGKHPPLSAADIYWAVVLALWTFSLSAGLVVFFFRLVGCS